jgi:hypothetical protein
MTETQRTSLPGQTLYALLTVPDAFHYARSLMRHLDEG